MGDHIAFSELWNAFQVSALTGHASKDVQVSWPSEKEAWFMKPCEMLFYDVLNAQSINQPICTLPLYYCELYSE